VNSGKHYLCRGRLAVVVVLSMIFASPAVAREIKVIATSKPIHSLVAGVMAGVGVPTLIVEGSSSPHTFTLKPSGARALYTADVAFRVSETLEPFTRKIAESLPPTVQLVSLADAPGVRHLALRSSATFEAHDHAGDGHDQDGGDHAGDHDHSYDPHVWLDPTNATAMVREIAKVLAAAAPDHAEQYSANAAAVTAQIEALDAALKLELRAIEGRPFIVFHDATQYFERHYDLAAAGSITVSPDVQPSAKRLTEVRRKIKELGAVCVFSEPRFQPRLLEAVTEGTVARSAMLDPEGVELAPGPGLYAKLMGAVAKSLVSCLSGS
jgi:zinc transport system substrate-binding protein